MRQTPLINGLKKTGTKAEVHFDCGANDLLGQLPMFAISVLSVSLWFYIRHHMYPSLLSFSKASSLSWSWARTLRSLFLV